MSALPPLLLLYVLLALLCAPPHVRPDQDTPLVVSTLADSGAGSLRAALLAANNISSSSSSSSSPVRVTFAPLLSLATDSLGRQIAQIRLASVLPAITRPIVLDGYSLQPPDSLSSDIRLLLHAPPTSTSPPPPVLAIIAPGTTIQGLAIDQPLGAGVLIFSASARLEDVVVTRARSGSPVQVGAPNATIVRSDFGGLQPGARPSLALALLNSTSATDATGQLTSRHTLLVAASGATISSCLVLSDTTDSLTLRSSGACVQDTVIGIDHRQRTVLPAPRANANGVLLSSTSSHHNTLGPDCRISAPSHGVLLQGGAHHNTILRSTLMHAGLSGVSVIGNTPNNTIGPGNTLIGNAQDGIAVTGAPFTTILANDIGLQLDPVTRRPTPAGNARAGVRLANQTQHALLSSNNIGGNLLGGLRLEAAVSTTIQHNYIGAHRAFPHLPVANSQDAVWIAESTDTLMLSNSILFPAQAALALQPFALRTIVRGLTITDAEDSRQAAVSLLTACHDTLLDSLDITLSREAPALTVYESDRVTVSNAILRPPAASANTVEVFRSADFRLLNSSIDGTGTGLLLQQSPSATVQSCVFGLAPNGWERASASTVARLQTAIEVAPSSLPPPFAWPPPSTLVHGCVLAGPDRGFAVKDEGQHIVEDTAIGTENAFGLPMFAPSGILPPNAAVYVENNTPARASGDPLRAIVRRCRFVCFGTGVAIESGVSGVLIEDSDFDHQPCLDGGLNIASTLAASARALSMVVAREVTFQRNTVRGLTGNALALFASGPSVLIDSCTIDNSARAGISFGFATRGVHITNTTITNCADAALVFDSSSHTDITVSASTLSHNAAGARFELPADTFLASQAAFDFALADVLSFALPPSTISDCWNAVLHLQNSTALPSSAAPSSPPRVLWPPPLPLTIFNVNVTLLNNNQAAVWMEDQPLDLPIWTPNDYNDSTTTTTPPPFLAGSLRNALRLANLNSAKNTLSIAPPSHRLPAPPSPLPDHIKLLSPLPPIATEIHFNGAHPQPLAISFSTPPPTPPPADSIAIFFFIEPTPRASLANLALSSADVGVSALRVSNLEIHNLRLANLTTSGMVLRGSANHSISNCSCMVAPLEASCLTFFGVSGSSIKDITAFSAISTTTATRPALYLLSVTDIVLTNLNIGGFSQGLQITNGARITIATATIGRGHPSAPAALNPSIAALSTADSVSVSISDITIPTAHNTGILLSGSRAHTLRNIRVGVGWADTHNVTLMQTGIGVFGSFGIGPSEPSTVPATATNADVVLSNLAIGHCSDAALDIAYTSGRVYVSNSSIGGHILPSPLPFSPAPTSTFPNAFGLRVGARHVTVEESQILGNTLAGVQIGSTVSIFRLLNSRVGHGNCTPGLTASFNASLVTSAIKHPRSTLGNGAGLVLQNGVVIDPTTTAALSGALPPAFHLPASPSPPPLVQLTNTTVTCNGMDVVGELTFAQTYGCEEGPGLVSSLDDSGPGSLRMAITTISRLVLNDTVPPYLRAVRFSSCFRRALEATGEAPVIYLRSALPALSEKLQLLGPGFAFDTGVEPLPVPTIAVVLDGSNIPYNSVSNTPNSVIKIDGHQSGPRSGPGLTQIKGVQFQNCPSSCVLMENIFPTANPIFGHLRFASACAKAVGKAPNSCAGLMIVLTDGVVVSDVRVDGSLSSGIAASLCEDLNVGNVHITSTTYAAVSFGVSDRATLRNITTRGCAIGVHASSCRNLTVESADLADGIFGLSLTAVSLTASDVTAQMFQVAGAQLGMSSFTVSASSFSNNYGSGFAISNGGSGSDELSRVPGSSIIRSNISGNRNSGISFFDTSDALIADCFIDNNGQVGVLMFGANNTIRNSTMQRSPFGMQVTGIPPRGGENGYIGNNRVEDCHFHNLEQGLLIDTHASFTTVTGCNFGARLLSTQRAAAVRSSAILWAALRVVAANATISNNVFAGGGHDVLVETVAISPPSLSRNTFVRWHVCDADSTSEPPSTTGIPLILFAIQNEPAEIGDAFQPPIPVRVVPGPANPVFRDPEAAVYLSPADNFMLPIYPASCSDSPNNNPILALASTPLSPPAVPPPEFLISPTFVLPVNTTATSGLDEHSSGDSEVRLQLVFKLVNRPLFTFSRVLVAAPQARARCLQPHEQLMINLTGPLPIITNPTIIRAAMHVAPEAFGGTGAVCSSPVAHLVLSGALLPPPDVTPYTRPAAILSFTKTAIGSMLADLEMVDFAARCIASADTSILLSNVFLRACGTLDTDEPTAVFEGSSTSLIDVVISAAAQPSNTSSMAPQTFVLVQSASSFYVDGSRTFFEDCSLRILSSRRVDIRSATFDISTSPSRCPTHPAVSSELNPQPLPLALSLASIHAYDSAVEIRHTAIHAACGHGISILNCASAGILVSSTAINNTGGHGILVDSTASAVLQGLHIQQTSLDGIRLTGPVTSTTTMPQPSTTIHDCRGFGLAVVNGASETTADDLTISSCTLGGLLIAGFSTRRNSIQRARVTSCGGLANIAIRDGASNTRLTNTTSLFAVAGAGLLVDGDNTILDHVTASNNVGDGCTLLGGRGAHVASCVFIDNRQAGLQIVYATNTVISPPVLLSNNSVDRVVTSVIFSRPQVLRVTAAVGGLESLGTLHRAILLSNASPYRDTIIIDVPFVNVSVPLPLLDDPVTIQPGTAFSQPQHLPIIDGAALAALVGDPDTAAAVNPDGLVLTANAAGSTISSLALRNFPGSGVRLLAANVSLSTLDISGCGAAGLVASEGAANCTLSSSNIGFLSRSSPFPDLSGGADSSSPTQPNPGAMPSFLYQPHPNRIGVWLGDTMACAIDQSTVAGNSIADVVVGAGSSHARITNSLIGLAPTGDSLVNDTHGFSTDPDCFGCPLFSPFPPTTFGVAVLAGAENTLIEHCVVAGHANKSVSVGEALSNTQSPLAEEAAAALSLATTPPTSSTLIAHCIIGLDASGHQALAPHTLLGIHIHRFASDTRVLNTTAAGQSDACLFLEETVGVVVTDTWLGCDYTATRVITSPRPNFALRVFLAQPWQLTDIRNTVVAGSLQDGLEIRNSTNVRLRNCYVGVDSAGKKLLPSIGADGIYVVKSSNVVLQAVVVVGSNSDEIDIAESTNVTVSDSFLGVNPTCTQTSDHSGSGIEFTECLACLAENNTISSSQLDGIGLWRGSHRTVVRGNRIGLCLPPAAPATAAAAALAPTAHRIRRYGIRLVEAEDVLVENNTVVNVAAVIIVIGSLSPRATVRENYLERGSSDCIWIQANSSDNRVGPDNVLSGCTRGIVVFGGAGTLHNIIRGNRIAVESTAIRPDGSSSFFVKRQLLDPEKTWAAPIVAIAVLGPGSSNTTVIDNQIHTANTGILVQSAAAPTTLQDNVIFGDRSPVDPNDPLLSNNGIAVLESSGVLIERCKISSFAGDGIFVDARSSGPGVFDSILVRNGGRGAWFIFMAGAASRGNVAEGNAAGGLYPPGPLEVEVNTLADSAVEPGDLEEAERWATLADGFSSISLRRALVFANRNTGNRDRIVFAPQVLTFMIGNAGPLWEARVSLQKPLPPITDSVELVGLPFGAVARLDPDIAEKSLGDEQDRLSPGPIIIDGRGMYAYGLQLQGAATAGSSIRSLTLANFAVHGVLCDGTHDVVLERLGSFGANMAAAIALRNCQNVSMSGLHAGFEARWTGNYPNQLQVEYNTSTASQPSSAAVSISNSHHVILNDSVLAYGQTALRITNASAALISNTVVGLSPWPGEHGHRGSLGEAGGLGRLRLPVGGAGLELTNCRNCSLVETMVVGAQTGFRATSCVAPRLQSCVVLNSTSNGVAFGGRNRQARVTDCVIAGSTQNAVLISSDDVDFLLEGNRIGSGFVVGLDGNGTATGAGGSRRRRGAGGQTFTTSNGNGVTFLARANGHLLRSSWLIGNVNEGLSVFGSNNGVQNCVIGENQASGVLVFGDNTEISDSDVRGNAEAGVDIVQGVGARLLRNRITNNDVGVKVAARAADTLIGFGNVVRNNARGNVVLEPGAVTVDPRDIGQKPITTLSPTGAPTQQPTAAPTGGGPVASPSSSSSSPVVVIVVVILVLVLAAVVVGLVVYRRRRTDVSSQRQFLLEEMTRVLELPRQRAREHYETKFAQTLGSVEESDRVLRRLEIAEGGLLMPTPERVLGTGEHGRVIYAEVATGGDESSTNLNRLGNRRRGRGPVTGPSKLQPVAMKLLHKEEFSGQACVNLLLEGRALAMLEKHPNVIGLVGVKFTTLPVGLALDFCEEGDLRTFLRERKLPLELEAEAPPQHQDTSPVTGSRLLLHFAWQAARAVVHMHRNMLVHRDLAARNVLVTRRPCGASPYTMKLADLGLARALGVDGKDYYRKRSDGAVPVKWMCPNSVALRHWTKKSDVWSFGVLLWEIMSRGQTPYAELLGSEVIVKTTQGYRLPAPPGCPDQVHELMLECWAKQGKDRPGMASVLSRISAAGGGFERSLGRQDGQDGRDGQDGQDGPPGFMRNPGLAWVQEAHGSTASRSEFGFGDERQISDGLDERIEKEVDEETPV